VLANETGRLEALLNTLVVKKRPVPVSIFGVVEHKSHGRLLWPVLGSDAATRPCDEFARMSTSGYEKCITAPSQEEPSSMELLVIVGFEVFTTVTTKNIVFWDI
jgi:hypothetical protein